jgi:thiaminase/transcriptional activator TenA
MAERFSQRLRRAAEAVWEAQHQHPFVRGIADGSLDVDKFAFWVRQDYLFLLEYARLFALAAARSPDVETMRRFAELMSAVLETEMSLHRSYAAQFGMSDADLQREPKAPTTQGYTDFLMRVAALGDFAELVAALLPCLWGYYEIGQRLAQQPPPGDRRYAEWIEMYSSPAFAEWAYWCRDLLDRLTDGLPERQLLRLQEAFLTSSRYEWQFWEMAWNQDRWRV